MTFAKIAILFVAAFLQGVCIVAVPSTAMVLKAPINPVLTDQQYGFLFISQVVTSIVTTFFMGAIFRRVSKSKIYFFGIAMNIVYFLLLAASALNTHDASRALMLAFIANAFLGVGLGFLLSVCNVLAGDYWPEKRDAMLAGMHGFLGIGASLAPIIASHFHSGGNWHYFPLSAAASFVVVGILSWITRVPVVDSPLEQETKTHPRTPIMRGTLFFLIALLFYGLIESVMSNWTLPFLQTIKHYDHHAAAVSLSLFWGMLTVGRLVTMVLTMKFSPELFYRLAPMIAVTGLLIVISTENATILFFAYALIGLGCSCIFPLSVSLATRHDPLHREEIASLGLCFPMVGVGLGSFGVGQAIHHGWVSLANTFWIPLFCAAVLVIMIWFLAKLKEGHVT